VHAAGGSTGSTSVGPSARHRPARTPDGAVVYEMELKEDVLSCRYRSSQVAARDHLVTAPNKSVLVAGVGGVIGRNAAIEYARSGFRVRGVSRRTVSDENWERIGADLSDAEDARRAFADTGDVTHLVFAAYTQRTALAEQVAPNVALLRNTLDALLHNGSSLRHVTLYQGNKAYGSHLGRFKTPAKETDPRLLGPNFYYDQEDLLREEADRAGFDWTILRPEAVIGFATGNPMNLLMVIAAYIAITRELGLPLRFPGPQSVYDSVLYQMTDAQLLAQATMWAGDTPSARGEIFNVTNGDTVRWRHVWTAIARHYSLDLAEPMPMSLAESMPTKAPVWEAIVAKNGLVETPWSDLVDWSFGDFIFNSDFDNVSSTIKIRKAGFDGCLDSEDRMLELLDGLANRRIIPRLGIS
jgi:nucleoside-diphosphate-sugar epimerase